MAKRAKVICSPASVNMFSNASSILLILAKSLRKSHGENGLLMLCWRLHLTVRPRIELIKTRMANPSSDLHLAISGSSLSTPKVGISVVDSMRKSSSLQGRRTVQSVSMIIGGRDRQHETNLSRM